jgi:hypothetical protein
MNAALCGDHRVVHATRLPMPKEGKTQAEAAKEVGCSQRAVSYWEEEAASQNRSASKTKKPKRKRGRRTRLSRQGEEEIFKV